MSVLPDGVHPDDDVVARHVELHMTVHRPGRRKTACGELMSVMQPRFGAYLADGYAGRWCESCFPHVNPWTELLSAAHPTTKWAGRLLNTPAAHPHVNHPTGRSGA